VTLARSAMFRAIVDGANIATSRGGGGDTSDS
jgi:hypothetical protein